MFSSLLARAAVLIAAVGAAAGAWAQPAAGERVALVGLDSLGIEQERVTRLESLFRVEIGQLAGGAMLSPRAVREVAARPEHRECGSETRCLIAIGRALEVDVVVAGNVASLGDAFVVNIKAIDVATGQERARVASEPLRGNPDELIENVRVAAYRLLAPEKLRGSVRVLADIEGAQVIVDGAAAGTTPLARPIGGLVVGEHELEVRAAGYTGFKRKVEVEFQKTTRVVVSLSTDAAARALGGERRDRGASKPFYRSGWFWTAVGVATAAVVVGAVIGSRLGDQDTIGCPQDPRCAPR